MPHSIVLMEVWFFFSNNNHKENILLKQNIFFTFFPLVFILHVVVADHRAAARGGKVHAGICSDRKSVV